jgi:hypothetical protein
MYDFKYLNILYNNVPTKSYRKLHWKRCNENDRRYFKNHREERIKANSDCQKKRVRTYKIQSLEIIARFHNSEIKCWKCGERRMWCLTIGHINQDGSKDRKENGNGTQIYLRIINGDRPCEDLQIECFTCNCVFGFFGKYPNELRGNNHGH